MDDKLELRILSPEEKLDRSDFKLVDIVDSLLDHGIVVRGEVWLTIADVDLVFLGIHVVLANPDTITGNKSLENCSQSV